MADNTPIPTQGEPRGATCERLCFARGRHRWIFSWGPGEERDLLRAVADAAIRPAAGLDRMDAAMVWLRISESISGRPQPPLGGSR